MSIKYCFLINAISGIPPVLVCHFTKMKSSGLAVLMLQFMGCDATDSSVQLQLDFNLDLKFSDSGISITLDLRSQTI